jgi:hypothetical protein
MTATTRMPCFSETRRDAALAIAFGTRSTGNFSVLNQKSVTASAASVISPCPCHGSPSQKPRFSSPSIRPMLPISCRGSTFRKIDQVQCSPRAIAGSATCS